MNYQSDTLPEGARLVGQTPSMNNENVVPGLLKKHLAPRGRFGHLVVEQGSCQFVWEDAPEDIIDVDPSHPVVIAPERFHRVLLTGPVTLRVEFYEPKLTISNIQKAGDRPGEDYL